MIRSGTAFLVLALTCSCGSSDGSGALRHAAGAGAGTGGADGGVGDSSSARTGGASGSSTGGSSMGGTRSAGGNAGSGASSGGDMSAEASTTGSGTGGEGGTLDCATWPTDTWRMLAPTQAPSAREEPWVVPTDDGMIVFGGYNHQAAQTDPFLDDGAIYHLCDDTWTPMSMTGVPHAITDTVAQRPLGVWTGSELLVWGGFQSTSGGYEEGAQVSFAARYSAASDAWREMDRDGEPTARDESVRVWTGEKLLVWGGVAQSGDQAWVNHADGALYDPKTDRWTGISNAGAPSGRYATERAVWTGKQLVVWGGLSYAAGSGFDPVLSSLDDGSVYDLASDAWTPIASEGAPHGGLAPLAWTGKELIVVSNLDGYSMPGQILFEGGRFDPKLNAWSPMSAPSSALADTFEFANVKMYWVGSVLAVFGVKVSQGSGGPTLLLYDPESDAWTSGTVPSTPRFFNWQGATVVGDRLVVIGPGAGSADDRGAHHESTAVMVFDAETRSWTSLPDALNRSQPALAALPRHALVWGGKDIYTDLDAPNPCAGATGPCDPVTPTRQTLLADGAGIAY